MLLVVDGGWLISDNHRHLKSSGHADGVHSYGRMVDLLIAVLDR